MRYPTNRLGLVVLPSELGFAVPTPEQLAVRRLTTIHHGFWERARYNDVRFRSVFRNLVTNTFPLLADEHLQLHEDYDAPKRPKDSLMVEVVDDYLTMNGVIHCIREKHTRSCFEIQPADWINIKKGYQSRGHYSMGN